MKRCTRSLLAAVAEALVLPAAATVFAKPRPGSVPAGGTSAGEPGSGTIAPYRARFGRSRPVIADIGENSGTDPVDQVLPGFDATPSAQLLDVALAGIARRFGRSTAYGVALDLEYPGFRK